jgi:hypothetical protein
MRTRFTGADVQRCLLHMSNASAALLAMPRASPFAALETVLFHMSDRNATCSPRGREERKRLGAAPCCLAAMRALSRFQELNSVVEWVKE